MSRTRLFVARLPGAGETVRLRGAESAHARARRLSAGDAVELFDGTGGIAHARLVRRIRGELELAVDRIDPPAAPGVPVALLISGLRSERLSWAIEKATELAVERIVLVRAERTQPFRAGSALRERLARVARAAAKQSGAARWPLLEGPLDLAAALARETAPDRLLLEPEGDGFPRALSGSVALAIGPEGGWTKAEREAATELGWRPTALPAGKLRAETAAVCAIALALAAVNR